MLPAEHRYVAIIVFLGACLFCVFALDARMYWHEARLLYAVTNFDIAELLAGQFNPNQLGGLIDESGSGGFHLSKLAYLLLLNGLTGLPISADTQLLLGSFISLLMILASGFLLRSLMLQMDATRGAANWTLVAFLLTPLSMYLAGKLLSEVTALLPAIASVLLLTLATKSKARARLYYSILAGFTVTLTALFRLDASLIIFGFAVAGQIANPSFAGRETTRLQVLVFLIAAVTYMVALLASQGSIGSIFDYAVNVSSLSSKSVAMSVFGVLCFAGIVWIPAIIGACTRSAIQRFMIIWLLVSGSPMLILVAGYMVEPRYLVTALLPFSAIAGLGFDRLYAAIRRRNVRIGFVTTLAVALFLNSALTALMPYELNRQALLKLVDSYIPNTPETVILVPWSYTDFHFLQFARPDRQLANVHTPVQSLSGIDNQWGERLHEWYGDQYVTEQEGDRITMKWDSAYYIGWGVYPPVNTMITWAQLFGFDRIVRILRSLDLVDHKSQSWVWHSDRLDIMTITSVGQYTLYSVAQNDD